MKTSREESDFERRVMEGSIYRVPFHYFCKRFAKGWESLLFLWVHNLFMKYLEPWSNHFKTAEIKLYTELSSIAWSMLLTQQ